MNILAALHIIPFLTLPSAGQHAFGGPSLFPLSITRRAPRTAHNFAASKDGYALCDGRAFLLLTHRVVIELGAGCALPSLLSATLADPPAVVVITDYPDDTIMKNLSENVSRNRPHFNSSCDVHPLGYEWGKDVSPLL